MTFPLNDVRIGKESKLFYIRFERFTLTSRFQQQQTAFNGAAFVPSRRVR